jgi:hypothetical protein
MLVRALAILCLTLLPAGAAMAQPLAPSAAPPSAAAPEARPASPAAPQPPGQQQPGRVFCEQNVTYQLADPSSISDQYRRFLGIWSDAAWDVRTCAALIVQDVKPDGSASIVYVYGPEGSGSPVPGAVLHGTGVVRDGALRFQNSDGSQYAFRPGIVDMVGHWINPKGESFQATFKQTP